MSAPARRRIGVLVELFAGGEWAPHGLARLMGFLIEGAAESGRLRFDLVVPGYARARVEADLRQLNATEGTDWAVHALDEPLPFVLQAAEDRLLDGAHLTDLTAAPRPLVQMSQSDLPDRASGKANWLIRIAERRLGAARVMLRGGVVLHMMVTTARSLRELLKPILGPVWRIYAVPRARWRKARGQGAFGLRDLFLAELDWLGTTRLLPAARRAAVRQQRNNLFLDVQERGLQRLAIFAARHVKVDGWLAFAPDTFACLALPEPKAVLMAGMGAATFTSGVPAAIIAAGMARNERLVHVIPRIITFSRHVAQQELVLRYGADPARIHPIHHAPVDIARELPFLPPDRRPTAQSRLLAADMLRAHAAAQGWEYLEAFPFESVDYIVVSTQDRPYKNLIVVAEAVRRLIRRDRRPIKLIMTARLPSPEHSATARLIEDHGLGFDIVLMPLLPRAVHAALYHAALAAVHPSLWEGGTGAWPLDEANSVGVPALVAQSASMHEFVSAHGLGEYVFAPYDADALVQLIHHIADNRDAVRDAQLTVYRDRKAARSWARVADEYADAVCGTAGGMA